MTTWQAFVLGLIQGITEFLPVSSSGHLALVQYFLGFKNLQDYILFDLICHLGTLLAIFYVFFPVIKDSLIIHTNRFWQIVLGTLPLFPLVLLLKPIKAFFDHPQLLGPCFLISACLLFASLYGRSFIQSQTNKRSWQDPLTIGIFQAVAILPGISRSGATISAARLLGWQKEQSIQFSFLLAIPAILGGSIIEGWQAWHTSITVLSNLNPWTFLIGFFTSFLFGCLALQILIRLVIQDKWSYFAWYCLVLGIATTIYFNVFVSYIPHA
jgi:undecaprenyl-diphosphatase